MANINASLYHGNLELNFDCGGATRCKFALWEEMPPEDDEKCRWRECGSCRNHEAQADAIDRLRANLARQAKKIKDGGNDELSQ